ncbi:MAG: adenylosuccinate synthase [Bacteroidales bacterium]|jgi:adenylosuccinate synthase|nr:adenylosuccinate synthase [Bacteroidales bacterium]
MTQNSKSKADVLLGLQWGDEGKGKIVDVLTPKYDIVARFQGGPNAGHTLNFDGNKVVLHTIPSGIFRQNTCNVIGNGVIIDPYILIDKEIQSVQHLANVKDNLYISDKAHLILPTHRALDYVNETGRGEQKIGSTLKGIGPAYTDKTARNGLRVGDLLNNQFEKKYFALSQIHKKLIEYQGFKLSEIMIDGLPFIEYEQLWSLAAQKLSTYKITATEFLLNEALDAGKTVLCEGAQGSMLDIEFGSYPFVTSSNTTTSGVCSGLGISPRRIGNVYGLFKAYCTRVGAGPFPTELFDATGEQLRQKGCEFGSTTGRPRRCGWLDLPLLKYACMLNGVTELIMMKTDVLDDFENINICKSYNYNGEQTQQPPFDALDKVTPVYQSLNGWKNSGDTKNISAELQKYIEIIENYVDTKITMISVGPDRTQTINL